MSSVALRLELGEGKTMEQIKPKEAFFRDALVRAAHRTPFTVPGDWTRLDERALSAALVSASVGISGRGLHPAGGGGQPIPASSHRDAAAALTQFGDPPLRQFPTHDTLLLQIPRDALTRSPRAGGPEGGQRR